MLDVVIPACDPSKRVLFEPVGNETTGFTHTVVRSDVFGQSGEEDSASDSTVPPSTLDFSFRAGQVKDNYIQLCCTHSGASY